MRSHSKVSFLETTPESLTGDADCEGPVACPDLLTETRPGLLSVIGDRYVGRSVRGRGKSRRASLGSWLLGPAQEFTSISFHVRTRVGTSFFIHGGFMVLNGTFSIQRISFFFLFIFIWLIRLLCFVGLCPTIERAHGI